MNDPPKPKPESSPPARPTDEPDVGYGKSHGYGPGHGGPSGPGDVPAKTGAPKKGAIPPPADDDDDE